MGTRLDLMGWKKMAERKKTDLVQLGPRVREPLRNALESAAKARGVSMNTEINERLMRSFEDEVKLETEFARVQLYAILRVVANTMDHAGASTAMMSNMLTGETKNWVDNPFAYDQAVKAANYLLEQFRPPGDIAAATPNSTQIQNMGEEFAKGTVESLLEEEPTVIGDTQIPPRSQRDLGHLFNRLVARGEAR
jgi:hypothetical protein